MSDDQLPEAADASQWRWLLLDNEPPAPWDPAPIRIPGRLEIFELDVPIYAPSPKARWTWRAVDLDDTVRNSGRRWETPQEVMRYLTTLFVAATITIV